MDALHELIVSYRAGADKANELASKRTGNIDAELDALFMPQFERLATWEGGVTTREGAIAAMEFIINEAMVLDGPGEALACAVLSYLKSRASQ